MSSESLDPEVARYYACSEQADIMTVYASALCFLSAVIACIGFLAHGIAGVNSSVIMVGAVSVLSFGVFVAGNRDYRYGGNCSGFYEPIHRLLGNHTETYPDLDEWYESLEDRGKIPDINMEGYNDD